MDAIIPNNRDTRRRDSILLGRNFREGVEQWKRFEAIVEQHAALMEAAQSTIDATSFADLTQRSQTLLDRKKALDEKDNEFAEKYGLRTNGPLKTTKEREEYIRNLSKDAAIELAAVTKAICGFIELNAEIQRRIDGEPEPVIATEAAPPVTSKPETPAVYKQYTFIPPDRPVTFQKYEHTDTAIVARRICEEVGGTSWKARDLHGKAKEIAKLRKDLKVQVIDSICLVLNAELPEHRQLGEALFADDAMRVAEYLYSTEDRPKDREEICSAVATFRENGLPALRTAFGTILDMEQGALPDDVWQKHETLCDTLLGNAAFMALIGENDLEKTKADLHKRLALTAGRM